MECKTYIDSCIDAVGNRFTIGDTLAHVQCKIHGSNTGLTIEKGIVRAIEMLGTPGPDEDNIDGYFTICLEKKGCKRLSRVTPSKVIKLP